VEIEDELKEYEEEKYNKEMKGREEGKRRNRRR
jgi:hypothetical protein